jgi:hypothetical protein
VKLGWAAMAVLLNGCVLVAAAVIGGALAAGAYSYDQGEGRQDYRVSFDKLYDASVAVCEKRGYTLTLKTKDAGGTARIEGKLKSGEGFLFSIQKVTENTSRLGIRVGTWGDEKVTADLHNEVGRELELRYGK